MDHRIAMAAAAQGGLITRAEARDAGASDREITAWLRHGDLVVVRPGTYATSDHWATLDEHRGRPLARVRAAHRSVRIEHVLSHESAALVWDLPLLDARAAPPHLTRRDTRATHASGGVWHHGASYDDCQVHWVDGLPVLDQARTVLDLARRRTGRQSGLVAADAYLRRGLPRTALEAVLRDQMDGWPFTRAAERVIGDADGGAANAGESLARDLVLEAGLGPVETQFPVPHRGGTYFGDLRVGRHIIEFDGRIKYRSVARGGVADRELEEVLWDERLRHRDICAAGFGVSRLVYSDFWGQARERAKSRLLADHAEIVGRLGNDLPAELEAFARDVRAREQRPTG